jgi:hypothetical protein
MGRVLISAFLTDVMACSSVETAPSAYSCLLIRERHIPVYESDSAKATFIRPPHEMLLDRRLFSACSPSSSDVSKPHSAVQVLLVSREIHEGKLPPPPMVPLILILVLWVIWIGDGALCRISVSQLLIHRLAALLISMTGMRHDKVHISSEHSVRMLDSSEEDFQGFFQSR